MTRHEAHRRESIITLCCVLLFSGTAFAGQNPAQALRDPSVEARVNALVGQMTLEEKVGQLIQRDAGGGLTGPGRGGSNWEVLAARGEIGSLFNLTNPAWIDTVRPAGRGSATAVVRTLFLPA